MGYQDAGPDPIDMLPPLPHDAQRVGLDDWTAPGLRFASSLRPDRRSHRMIAWIGLLVLLLIVLIPVVMMFLN